MSIGFLVGAKDYLENIFIVSTIDTTRLLLHAIKVSPIERERRARSHKILSSRFFFCFCFCFVFFAVCCLLCAAGLLFLFLSFVCLSFKFSFSFCFSCWTVCQAFFRVPSFFLSSSKRFHELRPLRCCQKRSWEQDTARVDDEWEMWVKYDVIFSLWRSTWNFCTVVLAVGLCVVVDCSCRFSRLCVNNNINQSDDMNVLLYTHWLRSSSRCFFFFFQRRRRRRWIRSKKFRSKNWASSQSS